MGMPIMAGADLAAFLNMTRSPRALLYVIRRFTTHLYHLARYGRAMHLVNGVALVARLARSAQDLGVQMMVSNARAAPDHRRRQHMRCRGAARW